MKTREKAVNTKALAKSQTTSEKLMNRQKSSVAVAKDTSGTRENMAQDQALIRRRKVDNRRSKTLNTHKETKRKIRRHRHSVSRSQSNESVESEEDERLPKSQYGKPKQFTKLKSECAQMTKWIDITIKELHHKLKEEQKQHRPVDEEENCPICLCELYDNILTYSNEKITELQNEQLDDPSTINVVKFSRCMDHFYHKECAESMLKHKTCIK